ncbi:hypothetical protein Tco_0173340 [Tanacetum coccineum]
MPTAAEAEMPVIEVETKNGAKNGAENKLIKTPENKETMEAPGSQPIAHYLKHKINEKLIKGLVNNNKFNNSRSRTRSSNTKLICTKEEDGDVMFIEIISRYDNSHKEESEAGVQE